VDSAGKEAEETWVEDGHLEDGLDETEETLKAGYERVLAAVEVIMPARHLLTRIGAKPNELF